MKWFGLFSPRRIEKMYDFYFFFVKGPLADSLHVGGKVILFLGGETLGTKIILLSARLSPSKGKIKSVKIILGKGNDVLGKLISSGVSRGEATARSIILSLPDETGGIIRKGVILIAFTRTLAFYTNNLELLRRLDKYFVFVLEPSWTGYADPDILFFLKNTECSLVQATELTDRTLINSVFDDVRSLSFGASNWVDSDLFKPSEASKIYDSVYVANLNHVKRIYRYLDAVRSIVSTSDPGYRGCLICAQWGAGKENIANQIKLLGLEENLKYIPGLMRDDLISELNKSKSSILLSLKEGSNRSLFESMFVDVPVICLGENSGVNKSYINENTGCLVSDSSLEEALISMKANYNTFSPRAWALAHISATRTTEQLSLVLKKKYSDGVNCVLYIKVNRPELEYFELDMKGERLMQLLLDGFSDKNPGAEWDVINKIRNEIALVAKE